MTARISRVKINGIFLPVEDTSRRNGFNLNPPRTYEFRGEIISNVR